MLPENQKRWGVDQWAAYLSNHDLPCMPRSKTRLIELEAAQGEKLAARDLADIAAADPFLCLRLLREAEAHRVQRLGHDTTTPLAAVMQLGTDTFHKLLLNCPETDESASGLAECEARSHLASRLALRWGGARADISPDEIAMAALLSETGELLLWSFAPDVPKNALAALHSGQSPRSIQAQLDTCGFRFKDLTLKCATIWHSIPADPADPRHRQYAIQPVAAVRRHRPAPPGRRQHQSGAPLGHCRSQAHHPRRHP